MSWIKSLFQKEDTITLPYRAIMDIFIENLSCNAKIHSLESRIDELSWRIKKIEERLE